MVMSMNRIDEQNIGLRPHFLNIGLRPHFFNGTGNDLANVLRGNSAANILMGGAGFDTYYVGKGDTILDSDGTGQVVFNSSVLTGGTKKKGEATYHSKDGKFEYDWSGSTLSVYMLGGGSDAANDASYGKYLERRAA